MKEILLFGAVGGLLPDVLRIYALLRSSGQLTGSIPFRSWRFWVSLLIQVCLGAFAAWFLEAEGIRQAIPIGFAAPELLTKALSAPQNGSRGADRHPGGERRNIDVQSFRGWWAR